jgi:PAS domain S-box-containing protein
MCEAQAYAKQTGYGLDMRKAANGQMDHLIHQSDERFHLLSSILPVGILYCDAFGHCLYVNRRWQEITGSRVEDCMGEGWKNSIAPEELDRVLSQWMTSPEGAGFSVEFALATKDGSQRWALMRTAAMRDRRGTLLGHACTLEDITARHQGELAAAREREEMLKEVRMQAAFLANASHEIRTPMNGIIGMTHLLLDTPLDEDQRDCAETVRSSAESLLTILNDILDFSKIKAGKLAFEKVDFDVGSVVKATLELLTAQAHEKGVRLTCCIPQDVPNHLLGDPIRLRQVLTNLIGNAIKFTDEGEVSVGVSFQGETESEIALRFEVRDTGPGVPPEVAGDLFQPFYQAASSGAGKQGGTGLGLAISKQLVGIMGGEIGVESGVGKGATFWFTAKFGKAPRSNAKPTSEMSIQDVRILLVEEDETRSRMLKCYFDAWKMKVDVAGSATEAMAHLHNVRQANQPVPIVVVDLDTAEAEGLDLAHSIKATPGLESVRIVALTSSDNEAASRELTAAGIDRPVGKPVHQSQLLDAIMSVIYGASSVCGPLAADVSGGDAGQGLAVTAKPVRILLADDSLVNLKVGIGQLRKLNHEPDTARNGTEVLAALEKGSYDIILMDGEMPLMDGYETTQAIRKAEQEGRNTWVAPVPIIAMTANAMSGDRQRCIDAGMSDYLSKPVRLGDLESVLKKWCAGNRPHAVAAPSESAPFIPVKETKGAAVPAFVSPSSAATAPVDMARLKDLASEDEGELRELVAYYFKQSEAMLAELDQAVASGTVVRVREIAHKLAGSSATCGMAAIVPPLRRMEAESKAGSLAGSPAALREARESHVRMRAFLDEHIALSRRVEWTTDGKAATTLSA